MVFVSWRCRHKTDFLATSALCTVLSTFSESLMNSTFGGSATSNQPPAQLLVLGPIYPRCFPAVQYQYCKTLSSCGIALHIS